MVSAESEDVCACPFRVREEFGEKMFWIAAVEPGVPYGADPRTGGEGARRLHRAILGRRGRFHHLNHDEVVDVPRFVVARHVRIGALRSPETSRVRRRRLYRLNALDVFGQIVLRRLGLFLEPNSVSGKGRGRSRGSARRIETRNSKLGQRTSSFDFQFRFEFRVSSFDTSRSSSSSPTPSQKLVCNRPSSTTSAVITRAVAGSRTRMRWPLVPGCNGTTVVVIRTFCPNITKVAGLPGLASTGSLETSPTLPPGPLGGLPVPRSDHPLLPGSIRAEGEPPTPRVASRGDLKGKILRLVGSPEFEDSFAPNGVKADSLDLAIPCHPGAPAPKIESSGLPAEVPRAPQFPSGPNRFEWLGISPGAKSGEASRRGITSLSSGGRRHALRNGASAERALRSGANIKTSRQSAYDSAFKGCGHGIARSTNGTFG